MNMRRLVVSLLFVLALQTLSVASGQVRIPGPGGGPPAGPPTITVTSALCPPNGVAAATTSCTLGAAGVVGDLLILKSKSSATVAGGVGPVWSFSGTASCSPVEIVPPALQPNGAGIFAVEEAACIVTTGGVTTPVVTWGGAGTAGFVDIEAFTVHTTNSWKTTFVDQIATNAAATTGVTCPTGTTPATTTANDFILATCDVFNATQTWGALTGYTQYAAVSRNTAGAYYKVVTSTGAQTTAVPLSATDFGLGIIVAFASN